MSNKIGDEYLLLKELGVGGFATVYKAKNLKYNYIRAIRVLNTFVAGEDEKVYRSFLRECAILLRLGNGCHPNIVHLYQPRCLDGRAFVEMDWIDGVDLRKLIEQHGGHVPIDETLRMVSQIGSALAYCHHDIYRVCYDKVSDKLDDADDGSALITPEIERRLIEKYRVIHNDIHTGNIMRRTDGAYMLLDFGLAVDGKEDVVNSSRRQQGAIEFLSSQRLDGGDPTPQDDIYAFGCVVYAMLAGHPPFPLSKTVGATGVTFSEQTRIYNAHKESPPPEIERDDVPQWLVDLTMRCLAKRPEERYADGFELYQDILENEAVAKAEAEREAQSEAAELTRLRDENRSLVQQLEAATQSHDEQQRQPIDCDREQLEHLLTQSMEASEELKRNLQSNKLRIDTLTSENEALKKAIQTEGHQLDTLASENKTLKQTMQDNRKRLDPLVAENTALQKKVKHNRRWRWVTGILCTILGVALTFAALIIMGIASGEWNLDEENPVPEGWVDLGLPSGLLWAQCNVGASQPEQYGDHYAWGETNVKTSYSWSSYRFGKRSNALTKYCSQSSYGRYGYTDRLTTLQPADDAATTVMFDNSRLPTQKDWEELRDHTTPEWTTLGGVHGVRLTASNGNSIFLPAAGSCKDGKRNRSEINGFYWSSSLLTSQPSEARTFCFDSRSCYTHHYERYYGFTLRAVRSKNNEWNNAEAVEAVAE